MDSVETSLTSINIIIFSVIIIIIIIIYVFIYLFRKCHVFFVFLYKIAIFQVLLMKEIF